MNRREFGIGAVAAGAVAAIPVLPQPYVFGGTTTEYLYDDQYVAISKARDKHMEHLCAEMRKYRNHSVLRVRAML